MKIARIITAGVAVLFFAYCKTTKAPAASPVPPTPPVAVAAPEKSPAALMQMAIVEKRWPGANAEVEIKAGQVIYTTKCVRCHKAYNIEEFGEKKWLHEIDDMSPKAKLTPEEKLNLTKYILSYRETKETLKGN